MLAYVFWHRPAEGVEVAPYEAALTAFHATLEEPSGAFRLDALPFGDGGPGYEDWYLVADWGDLGGLAERAVAARRAAQHDAVAAMAGPGWGGVWKLVRGAAEVPQAASFVRKPRGVLHAAFLDGQDAPALWLRQMVLGPAPEVCLAAPDAQPGRVRVA